MKRLVDLAIVVAIAAAAVLYGPTWLDSMSDDGAEVSDDSTPAPDSDGLDSTERDRNRKEQDRIREDLLNGVRDAQIEQIEDQIDRLEEAERNCFAAARRPGGTDATCRTYVDRIRAAEQRLRATRDR